MPAFESITIKSDLTLELLKRREDLAARTAGLSGIDLMLAYSDLTDALICRIFDLAIEEAASEALTVRRKALRHIAIAAVGGYGRCEMSPFSDVDVAFIIDGEEDDEVDLVIKRAFRILMDVFDDAHLSVGYSYRRAEEVDHLPLETQTALLDARCITGSESVFTSFYSALREAINPAAFTAGHIDARTLSGTPFAVEPDIKEGPGGLRDLHAVRWLATVAYGLTNGAVWNGLRSRGILSDAEIIQAQEAHEFLSRTRNALHLLAGRALDVLNTSRHAQIAESLGFEDARGFISCYYTHAHRISRLFHKIADAGMECELAVEPGIIARNGRIHVLDRGLLVRDPTVVVRLFQHAQSYHLRISRETADLIAEHAASYRHSLEAGRLFLETLAKPGAAEALRLMADMGVLQAIVPQFGELMYLVPGDAAHRFTVGEHSLRAVQELESILAEGSEQFADILSRIQHFDVLFLAVLLHDIGKLDSRRDHAKSGAFRAAKFAAQLGMSEDAVAKVEFLVRNHLKMSETARLRDLRQKRTISAFTAFVRDQQLLDMLFLLTIADSRSVGAAHWSQVQMRFLFELHERAMAALRSPNAPGPDIERHRSRVRRELCLANLPADEVDEHCSSMPASYLLNTPPEELALHIGHVRTVRGGSPAVDIKDEPGGQFTELTVAAMDMPGLLSKVAGVLHALSIDVHAAQINTRHSTDDIAIDLLYIDFEGRQLAEMKKWQVEGELLNVLSGKISVDDLLKRWGKKEIKKPEGFGVKVLDNLSDHETVLEIRTDDTPGLLYYLTRKISELGFNIHSARIATWGHEARDAFYVTDPSGAKLTQAQADELAFAL